MQVEHKLKPPPHYVLRYGSSVAAPPCSIEPTLEDFAHLMRLRLLARTADHTKAAAADAVRRRLVPEAGRLPTILGGVVPTAATDHAARGVHFTMQQRGEITEEARKMLVELLEDRSG